MVCNKGPCCAAAQGVDIFAADFVVIPIHDHLHWSLALLCFLGEDGWARGASETGVCRRRAFLLHLDSMSCAPPVSVACIDLC